MKKVIAAIIVLVALTTATYAQVNEQGADTVGRRADTPSISKQQRSVAEQQLIKIKVDDLPPGIVKSIQSHGYSDWTIQDAYRNLVLKQYSVRLKKGNNIVFYTYDVNGNRVQE